MSDKHIRRTRWGHHYMAPVLLDHRSLKIIGFSMLLALSVVFLSGYVAGFKKAEVRLVSQVETVALALPTVVSAAAADIEPQLPIQAEPGEKIDVDIADKKPAAITRGVINVAHASHRKVSEKRSEIAMKKSSRATTVAASKQRDKKPGRKGSMAEAHPLAIGGPSESDPGQEVALLIQDTATEEDAIYSIQVGMYGQLENAERRVEELLETDLSGYLTDYINKQNKIRYNVRFGYFANHTSAKQALATFENELSGSGYIVRLQPGASASTGS